MRLGPDRRVRKRPEFQDITARGVRVSTEHFVLIAAAQRDAPQPSRLGITASRRVGNAVVRNRLKRLVRAAFREVQGLLPDGHDLLVICRQAGALDTRRVVEEWTRARPRLIKQLERPIAAPRGAAPRPSNAPRRSNPRAETPGGEILQGKAASESKDGS